MENDYPYMVVSKPEGTVEGLHIGSKLANGMTWGGSAYAIFQTWAEAARWQLSKGLRAKTDIVKFP